jgi:starch-binding outer membrane protein, SusD/RagB family
MKNIFKLITLSLIIGSISCTKLKNKNYSDIISSEFVPGSTETGALLGAAYGSWRDVVSPGDWSEGLWLAQEDCTDELCLPRKPYGFYDGGKWQRMQNHAWTVSESHVKSLWWPSYQGISNCNRVLAQLEAIGLNEDLKKSLIAEIKVLRASFYWVLCDNIGNVPILDKFDVPQGYVPTQNTRNEVYNFIVKEITEALPNLSDKNDKTTYARFNNKGAANALLAKIYLNAAVYSGTPQWDKCMQACDAVINSGLYKLEAVQRDAFSETNDNSKELIFSVPFDKIYTLTPNYDIQYLMTNYSTPKGIQTVLDLKQQTWGGVTMIPQFINTFSASDKRLKLGFFHGQQISSKGDSIKTSSGGFYLNLINELPYIDSTQEFHGFAPRKYEIPKNANPDMIGNDFVVLRYADILMMKAECLLRTNKPGAGILVSEVRKRSFDDPNEATVTDAKLAEPSIYNYGLRNVKQPPTYEGGANIIFGRFYDELGWEFVGEGHRRQDMIRFGTFNSKSWFCHSPSPATRSIFPIPLVELNKNTNLKQNPGY